MTLKTSPQLEANIEEAHKDLIGQNVNLVRLPGPSGFWLVKAGTSEAAEKEEGSKIYLEREIDGQDFLVCTS